MGTKNKFILICTKFSLIHVFQCYVICLNILIKICYSKFAMFFHINKKNKYLKWDYSITLEGHVISSRCYGHRSSSTEKSRLCQYFQSIYAVKSFRINPHTQFSFHVINFLRKKIKKPLWDHGLKGKMSWTIK